MMKKIEGERSPTAHGPATVNTSSRRRRVGAEVQAAWQASSAVRVGSKIYPNTSTGGTQVRGEARVIGKSAQVCVRW